MASRPESARVAADAEAPVVVAVPDNDENWTGETYFVDPETGKAMVTKYTNHKGVCIVMLLFRFSLTYRTTTSSAGPA